MLNYIGKTILYEIIRRNENLSDRQFKKKNENARKKLY